MPVVINGTAGITTPGMEATAMPTVGGDAVVESGSNSDGEWTRWADGTQVCVGTGGTYTTSSVANSIFISSSEEVFTFAQAFIAAPSVVDASVDTAGGSRALPGAPRSVSTTSANIRPYSHANNAQLQLGVFAKGRWK